MSFALNEETEKKSQNKKKSNQEDETDPYQI